MLLTSSALSKAASSALSKLAILIGDIEGEGKGVPGLLPLDVDGVSGGLLFGDGVLKSCLSARSLIRGSGLASRPIGTAR